MEKETQKLYMKDMTRQKMYDLFGITRISSIKELNDWLNQTVKLSSEEILVINTFQKGLVANIEDWNEHELSMGFIGPMINLFNFKVPYKLGFFAQRPLSGIVGDYEMIGRPDGTISKGGSEPQVPYFCFQEYKKELDNSRDPIGQNLAAMLVGQVLNKNKNIIYGCYIVGRNWHFMVLKGKEFSLSKSFSADDEDIFKIAKTLKALRSILFKKLGIKE